MLLSSSVMGKEGHAMLFDCKSETVATYAPIPEGTSIVIINSGLSHTLTSGEYSQRRSACEGAVAVIKRLFPDVNSLRDVSPEMLKKARSSFSDETMFARATHVVHENPRALTFAQALKTGDLNLAGSLMYEGHASLRENYHVTIPETDAIVDIAKTTDGVWGARMTGGE